VLCADGPVTSLAGLSLAAEHRRGHGALYDAVNAGRIGVAGLRTRLAGLPLPRMTDGRIVLAVDVSSWLRPDAATSPRQHPPRTISHDLVDQRPTLRGHRNRAGWRRVLGVDYREHGRTFPTRVGARALTRFLDSDSSGGYAPQRSPTGFEHFSGGRAAAHNRGRSCGSG
jgi:hypothetical protein